MRVIREKDVKEARKPTLARQRRSKVVQARKNKDRTLTMRDGLNLCRLPHWLVSNKATLGLDEV